jgi:hypothetical protein
VSKAQKTEQKTRALIENGSTVMRARHRLKEERMKLPWIIFGLLLTMCGAMGSLFVTPEPTIVINEGEDPAPAGHGIPHPQIGTMLVGGDSLARYAPIRLATWIFAVSMVCFFKRGTIIEVELDSVRRSLGSNVRNGWHARKLRGIHR